MAVSVIPLAAGIFLLAAAIYKYLVYPAFLSPLAKIPNAHWSSAVSSLWILYHRYNQKDTHIVHEAHSRLGSIIRLGPSEISVNSFEGGIRTVYSGGFEKGTWYDIFVNYGTLNMFSMPERGLHSKRKRLMSNIYAKSTLHASPAFAKITESIINKRVIPRLTKAKESGQSIEFYYLFFAVTMDFVSNYLFGATSGTNFTDDKISSVKFFFDFRARQVYSFWSQETPTFLAFMRAIGLNWLLLPSWLAPANQYFEDWIMSMCDKAEKTLQAYESSTGGSSKLDMTDYPTVYAQLRNALQKEASKASKPAGADPDRLIIASEMLDHSLAGFDTSSITLTWLSWELNRPQNVSWQRKLRDELAPLNGSLDAKTLDNLPVLHGILMESLRLHAAIPGNQPRITPATPVLLGDVENGGITVSDLPPNTRVQAQAWSLHRNPVVFPDPETWNPARWIDASEEQQREMARWFWAFGSGGRMCVGSNLAMANMKAIIAGIWGNFSTELVDDKGMVHNGGYIADPLGVGPNGGEKDTWENSRFLLLKVT